MNADPKLVQQITEAVLASMRGRPGVSPASIAPPAGTCTAEGSNGSASPRPPSDSAVPALHGVVTATQLQAALDQAGDGVARLAYDARLTPLANDLARRQAERVRRVAAGKGASAASTGMAWSWWIDGACPVAMRLGQQHADRLRPNSAPRSSASLASVLADLDQAIDRREVAGGIVYSQQPAVAAALANRHRSLRALPARGVEDLVAAVDLGPNTVVIDYPRASAEAIAAIVTQAIASTPSPCPTVRRHLDAAGRRGGVL
ncbi:MAG: hypothetical protein AAF586_10365 [Planctomycetota bacterium]